MRAGRLRHRLSLQRRDDTRDAYGASVPGWTEFAEVWGSIEPLSGREYFAQQQIQAEASVRIVMRYNATMNENCRIVHGGKYYDPTAVINHDERNAMLTIMCREGVSEDYGVTGASMLLLEDGFALLLEGGDNLLLET